MGWTINWAFLIIMIPSLLVAAGYIVVLQLMGITPGYPRLVVVMILFFAAIYWSSRGSWRKSGTGKQWEKRREAAALQNGYHGNF